jgi:hypothetical protein
MFTRQISTLLIIASASMGQQNVVVPIGTRRSIFVPNQLYVNASLPWLNDTVLPADLFPQAYGCSAYLPLDTLGMSESSVDFFMPAHLAENRVRLDCDASRPRWSLSDYTARLGIGPGSALVRNIGSVDVIWQMAGSADQPVALVLNSSLDWFNSVACTPETVITIPASLQYDVGVSASVGDRNYTIQDVYVVAGSDLIDLIAEIPQRLWLAILRKLANFGVSVNMRRSQPSRTFSNCQEIRRNLPPIDFTFSAGTLTLYPQDYIRMVDSDDHCEILLDSREIGSVRVSTAPLRINPILFKGTNVRFTNDQMSFCESAIVDNHLEF